MSKPVQWERNVWTGHDILRVSKNARVLRQSFGPNRFLYWGEFWGDYSLRFPLKGECRATLAAAKQDCADLANKGADHG